MAMKRHTQRSTAPAVPICRNKGFADVAAGLDEMLLKSTFFRKMSSLQMNSKVDKVIDEYAPL
jgi:hypothetical protein